MTHPENPETLPPYAYAGARAMVILHERELRKFLVVWQRAKVMALPLPETVDPDYESLEALLLHLLRAARGYMVWMCEVLELPDPNIVAVTSLNQIEADAPAFLDQLFLKWRTPLCQVPEGRFNKPEFKSRWGVRYCVDAMLEHAVMHPIRHAFQLEELMRQTGQSPAMR